MKTKHIYLTTIGVLIALLFVTTSLNTADKIIKSTEPHIQELAAATADFKNSLSEKIQKKACKPIDDKEMFQWNAIPPSLNSRGGEKFENLSDKQLILIYEVFDAFLSDAGYRKVELITKNAETFLEEINSKIWGSRNYHFVLFGDPEKDATWGVQLDGHHCAINFVVSGDEITITPAFLGAEPAIIDGHRIFGEEEDLGFKFINSLDEKQLEMAIIKQGNPKDEIETVPRMFFDKDKARKFDYSKFENTGIKTSELDEKQEETLREIINVHVNNLDAKYSSQWHRDIDEAFENTIFSWIGPTTQGERIYYRIYNKAILIEFDYPGGMALKEEKDRTNHVHTITRSTNGQDYNGIGLINGPETIQEHYDNADHHQHD